MSYIDALLPEYDMEMAKTRRLLERIPADRLAWKPHGKSRSLGELATHLTELARWGTRAKAASFQVGSEKAPEMTSAADYVARFDANVAGSRSALAGMPDETLDAKYQVLKPDGSVFFEATRRSLLRGVLMNHAIHHRGQLSVYLRENDVPIPSIYGPSADEGI
ncbi:MAG TPA: DinB family protein [Thermoanaerobaculia bacterium]|nr:DinB family protein [Thermoanaerobaculia bacterium]